jgi:hypothetical protein
VQGAFERSLKRLGFALAHKRVYQKDVALEACPVPAIIFHSTARERLEVRGD